jgi:hypothetical protein
MKKFVAWLDRRIWKALSDDFINEEIDEAINEVLARIEKAYQALKPEGKIGRVGKGCLWVEFYKEEDEEMLFKILDKIKEELPKNKLLENLIKKRTQLELPKLSDEEKAVYFYKYEKGTEFKIEDEYFKIVGKNGGRSSFNPQYEIISLKSDKKRHISQSAISSYLPSSVETPKAEYEEKLSTKVDEDLEIKEVEELLQYLAIK